MAVNDKTPVKSSDQTDVSVASVAQNDKLSHSDDGVTTRSDRMDLGVPMLPGDPAEPVGPEDALGAGPTRGDYRERLGDSHYHPHTVVTVADAKPGEPTQVAVAQRPLADEIGEVPGRKGGVNSAASFS